MRKTILYIMLSLPAFASAQKIKVVTDSLSNHGIMIHDDIQKTVSWEEVAVFISSLPGWRLPTIKELKAIYEKTYDRQLLRSAVAPGTYFSSNHESSNLGDTVHLLGLMIGREFKAIAPQSPYNNLLLVKEY